MQTDTETTEVDDDLFPLCEHVVVHLAGDTQEGLNLVDRVVKALEQAGEALVVEAFLGAVEVCETEHDLLALIHHTVTVV